MKCIKCGLENQEYEDITERVKSVVKITKTDDKFGYIVLVDTEGSSRIKGVEPKIIELEIGSFDRDNKFGYWGSETEGEPYIVRIPDAGSRFGYFKVYKKTASAK